MRRVLRVKAALGLFDDPFRRIVPARAQAAQRRPETLALAREAARKSIVLLKNEGDLLPLKRGGQRIALIGPMATDWVNRRRAVDAVRRRRHRQSISPAQCARR